jgi:hypothetical protein
MRSSRVGRLLAATVLAGLVALAGAPPAGAWTTRFGHVGAPDRVLRPGCHHYRYHYLVRPHGHDWAAETFLVDPRGDGLASGLFDPDSDPKRGHGNFIICKASTRPGIFTIRMKVSIFKGPDPTVHWVKKSHFRLRRP